MNMNCGINQEYTLLAKPLASTGALTTAQAAIAADDAAIAPAVRAPRVPPLPKQQAVSGGKW